MNEKRISGLMGTVALGLMLGLMWLGDATPSAFALLGLGAAVMVAVCLIAEF